MSEEHVENEDENRIFLKKLKHDLYGQNIVAFIGPPNSGKTVIATLLQESFFNGFIQKNEDDYNVQMIKGYEFLKTTRSTMLDGAFPSPTLPNNEGEIIFKIARKGPLGKEIQLIIKDISGEDYESLLLSGDLNAEQRTRGVLKHQKTRAIPYGPLSFIVVAQTYVVTLDCSLYCDWKRHDLDYAQLLNSLLHFQTTRGDNENKITSSLAVVLTKADCLPDEISDSAKDIVANQMPQFYHGLNTLHSGIKGYFKLSVDVNRTSTNEQEPDKIKVPWSYSSDEYNQLISWILSSVS